MQTHRFISSPPFVNSSLATKGCFAGTFSSQLGFTGEEGSVQWAKVPSYSKSRSLLQHFSLTWLTYLTKDYRGADSLPPFARILLHMCCTLSANTVRQINGSMELFHFQKRNAALKIFKQTVFKIANICLSDTSIKLQENYYACGNYFFYENLSRLLNQQAV